MKNKIVALLGIVLIITLLSTTTVGCTAALQSIAASPSKISLAVSGTQQLAVTTTDTKGKTASVTTTSTYKSSDVKVATVSTGGLVTGVAAGSVNITVSYTKGKVTKTATVAVTVASVLKSIAASPVSANLTANGTQQLKITATVDTTTTDVTTACTYTSSDAKVATVSTGGLVTGVAAGSVNISVSYTKGTVTKTATVAVTVK